LRAKTPIVPGTGLAFCGDVTLTCTGRTAAVVLLLLGAGAGITTAEPVAVELARKGDAYVVEAAFEVRAPADVAWRVLTDYEGIATFVSSIRHSTIRERQPGRVVLEQQGVGKAWILSVPMHVVLEVREEDGRRLAFRDLCGKSFTIYEGRWEVDEADGRTSVRYSLRADPTGRRPAMFARPAIRGSVRKLLEEVRAEILVRAAR
jgi:carbon monoxide dehydrogenase subunit G